MKNNQPTQSVNKVNQSNNNLGRNIALAGVAAAGAAGVGGAAGYAATMLNDEAEVEEAVAEEAVEETVAAQASEAESAAVERPAVREVRQEEEVVEEHDNQIVYDIDNAEVRVLEVGQGEEGGYLATAEVDGHAAVFVDANEDGVVDVLGIDINNNQHLEDNEVIDVSDRNIGMDNLAAAVETPSESGNTPEYLDPSQVQVEEVATDVNMDGYQVNMASVSYQGHAGMAVDADQDGDAEMMAIDLNDSNSYEDEEYYNVSEGAIMMETNGNNAGAMPEPMSEPEPDVYNDPTSGLDGLPDYTNDGNIDGYVI